MDIRFRFQASQEISCEGAHSRHSNGDARHGFEAHDTGLTSYGPNTGWIPIADLLDDNDADPPPAPEQPADNEDAPEDDTSNADALARLRAELDALRGDLSAVRDSLQAALSAADGTATTVTLIDTVEVARVDMVHFCPPTDEDRQALFDAFTGVNSDTSGTGGAGKAAVRVESWGAIKALVREE